MKKKLWILISVGTLFILSIIFSSKIITTGPYSGNVIDFVTGEPIVGIRVEIRANVYPFLPPNPGGNSLKTFREEVYFTDDKGYFAIPKKKNILFITSQFRNEALWINSKEYYWLSYEGINEDYQDYRATYMEKPWQTVMYNNEFFSINDKPTEPMIIKLPKK